MAKAVYKSENIMLIDGEQIYITPLKIKYLREFMEEFGNVKDAKDDDDAIYRLAVCVAIAMKQYCPRLSTVEDVEDNLDLDTMYTILEIAADIKMKSEEDATPQEVVSTAKSGESWDNLDLPKLESELFLLGIWKDYEELETSLSMPELMATLAAKRDLDYTEKKFLAAMQGVDLDEATNKKSGEEDPWQKLQARAAARAAGKDPDTATMADPNDITSFTGLKAQQAGFGIGMGIEYSTTI